MSSHVAAHAKPHLHKRVAVTLKNVAKIYTAAHKRYRVAGVVFISCVELAALILTHEFLVHLGILAGVTIWDTLVTLVEG